MTSPTANETLDVLVVDDNPHIRRLLALTLRKDFTVLECEDAVSAMEALLERKPRVVLLDIMMPGGVDGLQLLEAIRCRPLSEPIAIGMVTAKGQQSDEVLALTKGADAYFVKPFSPQRVHAWVHQRIHGTADGEAA